MKKNNKMLNKQNFSIYNIAEHCIMNSSDMNPERVRHLETSNRTVSKCEFISEKEKKAQRQAE